MKNDLTLLFKFAFALSWAICDGLLAALTVIIVVVAFVFALTIGKYVSPIAMYQIAREAGKKRYAEQKAEAWEQINKIKGK